MVMKKVRTIEDLGELIRELDYLETLFKKTDIPEARKSYNQYARIMITYSGEEIRPVLYSYWEKIIK